MLLQGALLLSMLVQLGAAITAVSLIRRTRFNVSWILISAGFVLMTLRRLFEFSTLFSDTKLFSKEDINSWIGVLVSILMLVSVIFIRRIFNLQDQLERIREGNEINLLRAIIRTEETTRQLVARDLHDGLGPVLSSIKMTVSAIDLEKIDGTNKEILTRTANASDEAIVALKEISNQLSPHLLKHYGLLNALETLAHQLLVNTEIQFELTGNTKDKRYDYELEISLFRVISELLNNSIKHAHPTKIDVKIEEVNNYLRIDYGDNGKGFSIGKSGRETKTHGMGLNNIHSRIKSLNGLYFIDSKPTQGMKVHIQIPMK